MTETPSPEATPTTPKPPNPKGCLLGCGGVLGGLVLLAVIVTLISNMGGGSNWTPTSTEATSICHDWVKEKLKAPATAKFSGDDSTGSGGSYVVTGNVDSQNSFGALVRSSWTCTINYSDSDEKWHGTALVDG